MPANQSGSEREAWIRYENTIAAILTLARAVTGHAGPMSEDEMIYAWGKMVQKIRVIDNVNPPVGRP